MTGNSDRGIGLAAAEPGHKVFRVSGQVRIAHNSDGATVLDIRLGQVFTVNVVGSRILELLKDSVKETEIVDRIRGEFGISAETAAGDVREFLLALKQSGLIEEQPAGIGESDAVSETPSVLRANSI